MSTYRLLFPTTILLMFASAAPWLTAQALFDSYELSVPRSGAQLVMPETGISLRPGPELAVSAEEILNHISVRGSSSGEHEGTVTIADDRRTFVFTPARTFRSGEDVSVSVRAGLRLANGERTEEMRFMFSVASEPYVRLDRDEVGRYCDKYLRLSEQGDSRKSASLHRRPTAIDWTDSVSSDEIDSFVPDDYPWYKILTRGEPAEGSVFISLFGGYGADDFVDYMLILDNDGESVWFDRRGWPAFDFKVNHNGSLTYYDGHWQRLDYAELDTNYVEVDRWAMKNGYDTDLHGLQLLENGHALMMAYDPKTIDMSEVVDGGDTAATVVGFVVQELDADKNVVFEWRSWDHFEFTDASDLVDLKSDHIDYVHGNAIEVDHDGNLLISSRHMDEITKIDRSSGDIMWRLGGKRNEFTFTNDTIQFSHQHDIRRLDNGNITIFDNGNGHNPALTRVVEYDLDEEERTATLVWEYRPEKDRYSFAMGNARRLPNGNTFIGWGYPSGESRGRIATEVDANADEVFQLRISRSAVSYRVFRHPWQGVAKAPHIWYDDRDRTKADSVLLKMRTFGLDGDVEKYYVYQWDYPNPEVLIDSTTENTVVVRELERGHSYLFRAVAKMKSGSVTDTSGNVRFTVLPIGPILRTAPSEVHIDSAVVQSQSARDTIVQVRNVGEEPLEIQEYRLYGEDSASFSVVTPNAPVTVAPSDTLDVQIAVEPTRTGNLEAILTFVSNAVNDSLVSVGLTALAAGSELAGTSVDFGRVRVGESKDSTAQPLVSNQGEGTITVESISVEGSDAFSIVGMSANLPADLEPGRGLNATVSFVPTEAIQYAGTITVMSTGVPSDLEVQLSGEGDTTSSVQGRTIESPTVSLSPTPFNDYVDITVENGATKGAHVEIFDALGARVRFIESTLAGSVDRIRWNGRDESGNSLPSGTYTVRVTIGDSVIDRSVQLLR